MKKKNLGESRMNHPKKPSTSKEDDAMCLLGLQTDPILPAFTKQRDDKIREMLFSVRKNKEIYQT